MLVNTPDEAERILNRLREHEGTLGLDVETSGLNPRKNHIVAYVISFSHNEHYYVPVRHAGGGNLPGGPAAPQESEGWDGALHPFDVEFGRIARDKAWNVVGHNLTFDLQFCARHGIFFNNSIYSCTQVAAAIADEHAPGFSLDASCRRWGVIEKLGNDLYAEIYERFKDEGCPEGRKSMSHYWRMTGDHPVVVDYACGDGVSTWALYHRLMEEMVKVTDAVSDESLERVWKLEQRVTRTLFKMMHRGIKIDEGELSRVKEKLAGIAAGIRKEFPEDFNERSGPKMTKLFTDAGFTDAQFQRSPTGKPSFTEDWLETNSLGRRIIELRQITNLDNSFAEPMLTHHLLHGRVHPNYNQLKGDEYGTISGRLSSNEPNIQQVPKRNKKLSKLIRAIFVPDEGKEWLSKDAKQCEPRIFSEFVGNDMLIGGYMQKPTIDLYNMMAKITGADRETCKRLALGIFYGAGIKKTATLIGCTEQEAAGYRQKLYDMVPEIPDFAHDAAYYMKTRGWVKTKIGRKLRIPDARFHYKSSNRIVQGNNADYIKLAICDVNDYLDSTGEGNVLLTCHDSIESQISIGRTDIAAEAIRIMEEAGKKLNFKIPQEVEFGSGHSWSEATFGAES